MNLLPRRRVVLASVFFLLVCIAAIVTSVVLVRRRHQTPTEPTDIHGVDVELPSSEVELPFVDNQTNVVEVGENATGVELASTPIPTTSDVEPVSQDPADVTEETSTQNARDSWGETLFYVIADVPYTDRERDKMPDLVAEIPDEAAFAVHLGDIKNAQDSCSESAVDDFADFVKETAVPMFVIVGDNEYNDCADPEDALDIWRSRLTRFDNRHWDHTLPVQTMPNREESFYFTNNGTLFIGLNIVGSPAFSDSEWNDRLDTQIDWTIALIEEHRTGDNEVGAVVIFGHASPNGDHDPFFNVLRKYISDVLQNSLPILYLCGDVHTWLYEENYENQPSWLRVRKESGTDDPPLRVVVRPAVTPGVNDSVQDVFDVARFW